MNLGIIALKKGNIEYCLQILKDCLAQTENNEYKAYKAWVNNGLAWAYLIKEEYQNADSHSKTAISIDPKQPHFQDTRGSVLIETGEVKQGINMLKPLVDFKYPNNETLAASMYLFYGFSLLGNEKKKSKYLKFVLDNISLLDKDELLIWKHIKKRTQENSINRTALNPA